MAESSTGVPAVDALTARLAAEGFTPDDAARAAAVERGRPLAHNGAYDVLAAYSRGPVTVVVARNTAPETPGGDSVTTHAPVARITGPAGTAGARVADVDAVLAVAADVA